MAGNGQTRTERRKQKQAKKKPIGKRILWGVLIACLAVMIGVGALFTYYIVTAPKIDASQLTDPFSSKIYDQDEELFADLGSEKRTKIEFDDLPQVLVDAVTATEDVRFFKHPGIDVRRIGAAVIANFKRGFGAEGASTITQQLVEKSFLPPDKKIKYKVQEAWLSLKLERKYSKEEILEMYLNKIFYGNGSYGVAKAAQNYFGVTDLNDLTLAEAAILAGLPQRPTAYNPFQNPDLTKKRMETVLKLMVRHDKITQEQADEAMKVNVEDLLTKTKTTSTPYEAFLQQVEREVKNKLDGVDINTDGLKIYTTLDPNVQKHVEFLLKDGGDNPIPYPDDEMQAAMTVLDTKTGAIRAIGGRRNSDGTGQYNYAIQGGQQPGSTFKPIVAYGPAIEYDKISTYHQLNDDKPYEVKGSTPIRNWNRKYQGWMSARYALSQSLNVPTVKLLEETGYGNAKKFAEGIGINFADDTISIRDAIGGTATIATPLQVAGAYRAFANEGIYNEPYAVTKVEFPDGRVVEMKSESKPAMSDYTAYMVTDMLKTAITEGTGTLANIPGLAVAGKTGTTTHPDKNGAPDSWFTGYTTNYTISVWTGGYTDENGKRTVIPNSQTKIPHALFKNTMTEISKEIETKDFKMPSSVVKIGVEKGSNPPALPSKYTPQTLITNELFVKGNEPKQTSERYDKLDPVKKLKAKYDEDANAIEVKWKHDSDQDVTFEVSASVNGGSMQVLSTTDDTEMTIEQVETDATYDIQVVVVSAQDSANRSDAVSTKVKTPKDEEEEEEDEEEEESMVPVSGLEASYKEDSGIIDVSWEYEGPAASFEVDVNGQKQTVSSNGIEISGVKPDTTYTITVTPIGKEGANEGIRAEPRNTSVQTPPQEEEEDPGEEQPDEGE